MPIARLSRSSGLLGQWETRTSRVLQLVGLTSVRTTILTLAVLASLIPALATGCISYRQNRRVIEDKLVQQLTALSTQAARDADLWLKERIYNLRVFAASYEVSENLARGNAPARVRLTNYLRSVAERFESIDELLAVAPDQSVLASSDRVAGSLRFSGDWLAPARVGDPVLGDPFLSDSAAARIEMEVAVPIVSPTGRFVGVLVARLNFTEVEQQLRNVVSERAGHLTLLRRNGTVIASTRGHDPLSEEVLGRLEQAEGMPISYDGADGVGVVGSLAPVPRTTWSMVADIPQADAFAEITRIRNATLTLMLVLMLVVGSLAWALGLLIVQPLGRLSRAARSVAAGDLETEVPMAGGGELAQLGEVFNEMVRRLRETHAELERLTVTDPLTGLANRRRLMAEIEREVTRSDRHERQFSLLMLDVDHFKRFNDTHGHQAGDELLRRLGSALREAVRDVDTAARYGGEEFTVVLPETPVDEAARVAERIRERASAERFATGNGATSITVSIGLAHFPADADTPDELIAAADKALYRAKESGRNRVVVASANTESTPPPTAPRGRSRRKETT